MILIIKHKDIEGAGLFGDFFKSKTNYKVKIIELEKKDKFPSLDECKAIISLGGPMSVYQEEEYPFLKEEKIFLKEAIKKDIPILGVCLGAQLLASVLKAKVEKAKNPEIGWHEVNLIASAKKDPLFYNLPKTLKVFQWHEDTFKIPKMGVLLATTNTCKNQAVRFSRYCWGLQFHPEMNLKMLKEWLKVYEGYNLDKEKIINSFSAIKRIYLKQAETLFDNFLRIIKKR